MADENPSVPDAPEAPTSAPEVPAQPETPVEPEKPADGPADAPAAPQPPTPKAAKQKAAKLVANSDGVDLAASTLPEVPTVNTPPAPDPEAVPLTASEAAQKTADPSPEQEGALQVPTHPNHVDGSGILQQTNQEVIDQFPRNAQGQVVIDSEGNVVGLNGSDQPSQPAGSAV